MNNLRDSDQQKVLHNLYMLPKTAEKEKWEFFYDKELDNLYYSPKKIHRESRLFNLNDEVAFYITPDFNISGIMIEYLSQNFIQHQKEFKKMLTIFRKPENTLAKVDKRKERKARIYMDALITEILKNAPDPQFISD